jgi:hypothetical protein
LHSGDPGLETLLEHKMLDVLLHKNSLTHGAESFLRSRQLCSYSRTSKHFIEPERSLPCSQEPSTGPHPEPDRSSPQHPILSLRSILILSLTWRLKTKSLNLIFSSVLLDLYLLWRLKLIKSSRVMSHVSWLKITDVSEPVFVPGGGKRDGQWTLGHSENLLIFFPLDSIFCPCLLYFHIRYNCPYSQYTLHQRATVCPFITSVLWTADGDRDSSWNDDHVQPSDTADSLKRFL